jgi:putative flippase GtrA
MLTATISSDLVNKFLKFAVVGSSGVLVDFGFTFLFKEKFRVQKYVANAIGFSTAVVSNYFFNRIWTFESSNTHMMHEFSVFLLAAIAGLGINTCVLWFLVSKQKNKFYFSKLIAIGVVTIWNFCINYFITFRLR